MTSPRVPEPGPAWNPETAEEERTLSGRWVVVAMFAFAIAATVTLFVYWKLHVGPFVPLQKALAKEFKGSHPLVEGGQRKMHKNTPKIVRITMRVDFDPNANEGQTLELARRVIAFTQKSFDISTYEILETHFFWAEPEKTIHQWSKEWKIAELE